MTGSHSSSLLIDAQLDKLVTSQLGLVAQRRLARGVKLNHAEATVRFVLLDRYSTVADCFRVQALIANNLQEVDCCTDSSHSC